MSVIEELHRARKERLARFQRATLQHFDRCYDEALASLPPPPEPPVKPVLTRINAAPRPFQVPLKIASIQKTVAERFNITREQLVSPSKKAEYVRPRQIAIYLARKTTDLPLKKLGKNFGGRDHTTILFAARSVESMMAQDANFAATVTELCAEFTA
jgi:chromosomal replication initiation ATPase DnaA